MWLMCMSESRDSQFLMIAPSFCFMFFKSFRIQMTPSLVKPVTFYMQFHGIYFLCVSSVFECELSNSLQHNYSCLFFTKSVTGRSFSVVLDVTVDGIANSKYLWFYSILGLFRVSFEYLDINFQRYCLQHLTVSILAIFAMSSVFVILRVCYVIDM